MLRLSALELEVGYLIGAARLIVGDLSNHFNVISDSADNALPHGAELREILTVVDINTVVRSGLVIVGFYVYAVVIASCYGTLKRNLDTVIVRDIDTKLRKSQLNCLSVVEIGVLLSRKYVQLRRLCLIEGCNSGISVSVLSRIGSYCETFLKNLYIEVSVLCVRRRSVPYPYEVSCTRRVNIPALIIRLDNDALCVLELLFGEGCRLFTVFLYSAGGFGSVYSDISRLKNTRRAYRGGNVKVRCVTVNVSLYGNLLLQRGACHLKFKVRDVVHEVSPAALCDKITGCERGGKESYQEKYRYKSDISFHIFIYR